MRVDQTTRISTAVTNQDARLKKVCQQAEGIFLNYLLKSMRKTVTSNDLFGSAQKEELFRDMMDTEISERAAQNGSFGIAEMLYKQLSPDDRRGAKP